MEKKLSFLGQNRPLNTCMIQAKTPEAARILIRNAAFDGADAYGFQYEKLGREYRTEKDLDRLFACMAGRPVYVTNYRKPENADLDDDALAEGLLLLRSHGAVLIDIMGDMFCPDQLQLTHDAAAVDKQKALIGRIHEAGGEVLMSSHTFRYLPAEDVVAMALEQQSRGADIVKIVTAADTEEEELENLRITALLRKTLDVPFLFLSGGSHCKLHRQIGPYLGCAMWLTVQTHDALSTPMQPLCRAVTAIADNFDY